MAMDAELYSRVRKLEKQVEALIERHPEVREVVERGTVAMEVPAGIAELERLVAIGRQTAAELQELRRQFTSDAP